MKKIWAFAVALLLLITGSSCWAVQTADFLNEHVICLDSIPGTHGECDSAHVWTLFGNADYPCYMARTTDCGGSWIDSVDYAGKLHASYRFFDQVADCDCDSGAGSYTMIVTLYGSGVPTENSFKFELTDSSFNGILTRVGQMNYEVLKPTTVTRKLDVTANGEAGIDLDNASGTLDAGEIGANAITAAKIADGAIDYATFAATPPTAWWPEGKTGYKLAADGLDIDTSFSNVQTHIVEDSTNIEAVKAKTDSSSYGPSGHIKSTPQTDVTLSGGTIAGIATANWVAGTRTLTVADWSTHSATDAAHAAYETLYVHKADFHSDGDTNTNPFQAGTDSVMHTTSIPVYIANLPDSTTVDISNLWPLVANRPAIGDTNSKDMGDTLTLIMAEILNLNGWSIPDSFTVDISNLWPLVSTRPAIGDTNSKDLGDTLTLIMAEILNLDAWNPANGVLCWLDGDSLYTLTVKADSLILAITDVNKANFKAAGFSVAGDPMTLQSDSLYTLLNNLIAFKDSVEAAVADAGKLGVAAAAGDTTIAHAPHGDDWASAGAGSSPWTTAGVGSVYVYLDSNLTLSRNLAYFWGACDLCYEIHFPPDGTANKDSSYLVNPGLSGSDTLVAKVEFKHSNVADVADSSYYYLNPWW